MTTETIHALAPEHLPRYIGGPDGSDPLFTVVVWLLVILLMVIGNFYLKLHALPERMAHKQNNTQLQINASTVSNPAVCGAFSWRLSVPMKPAIDKHSLISNSSTLAESVKVNV